MGVKLKPIAEQVIVITGATSGIGRATALEAARRGARVALFSRDEADLRGVAEEIQVDGGNVVTETGDVADFDAMQRLADTAIRTFGRIDSWVNNAGVSIYGRIRDVALDDARRLFETNYWGVVHGSLAAVPRLEQRGGALINVGSVLSETGYPLQGHYAASKHAVKGFTDSLRLELMKEESPIQVTLIQPAAIDTPYPSHARNYLATEPTHAAPVYDPQLVADAILECAEHPHRNLRVGGGAKMFTVIEKTAPGLADRMKMSSFEASHSDRAPRNEETLWEPRAHDARVRGDYEGHVKKTSAYTTMATHPRATTVTALGVAALGIGLGLAAKAYLDNAD